MSSNVSALAFPSHQKAAYHANRIAPFQPRKLLPGQWNVSGCGQCGGCITRAARVAWAGFSERHSRRQLVLSLKLGCGSAGAFGRVKSAAVCGGIDLVWCEGGALTAVATASVRPNPPLKWDVPQAARPLALRWATTRCRDE